MLRLQNDTLSRILHETLYQRMLSFCQEHTPEIPADIPVRTWLSRLYNSDPTLHILVHINNNTLVAHAVISIDNLHGQTIVCIQQVQIDDKKSTLLDEVSEYADKLVIQTNAYCSILYTAKNAKALEKKYSYNAVRTIMIKYATPIDEEEDHG